MIYTVNIGDSLSKIAQKFNVNIQNILAVNPQIRNPNVISIGQEITIPGVGAGKAPNGGLGTFEPGIAGQKPLRIVSAALPNGTNVQGATNIPINPNIILTFDRNVVNNTVWANNQSSISLISTSGINVPITLTKVSDKVDYNQRQKIYVQTVNHLAPGTDYILRILPNLRSLNGHTISETTGGQNISITFRTR